jgi:hypothetical protein
MPQNNLVKSPRTVAHGQEKFVLWMDKWLLNGTQAPKTPGASSWLSSATRMENNTGWISVSGAVSSSKVDY